MRVYWLPIWQERVEVVGLETKEIFVSLDVEFIKIKYPFSIDVTTKEDVPPKNWSREEIVGDMLMV